MTYTPAIPLGGLLGWRVFSESADRQLEAFSNSDAATRDVAYFKENIENATSAGKLIEDRKLLSVALGAFGLEDEINKKALIRTILEDGTDLDDAYANRIADPRWKDFAEAFGYGNFSGPQIATAGFADTISQQYLERTFEARVGDVDTDMRLAMNFRRQAETIAQDPNVDRIGWFQLMGQLPLRTVVEAAFGLPSEFGTADIDKQKSELEDRAAEMFGDKSPAVFSDPEVVDEMLRRYFLKVEIDNGPSSSTPGMGAISLLTTSPASSGQTINLILSNAL